MTAATWTSLWVSTPRTASSGATTVGSTWAWLGSGAWGILGTVVRLLLRSGDGGVGVRRPAGGVGAVLVPCSRQGPYRDTPRRSGGSTHRPEPVTDRSNA